MYLSNGNVINDRSQYYKQSSPNSKGFPPNGGLKEGWGKKIQ